MIIVFESKSQTRPRPDVAPFHAHCVECNALRPFTTYDTRDIEVILFVIRIPSSKWRQVACCDYCETERPQ